MPSPKMSPGGGGGPSSSSGQQPQPTPSSPGEGAKVLQERLHQLLTRLSSTIELIKTWPESGGDGDASVHVETTTKLISSILEVINALQRVEHVVKQDTTLRKTLTDCKIPLDLLDLLDYGNGLNPDCFSRGLLREALGQLAGLKRRKLALEMLGIAVQKGLQIKDKEKTNKNNNNDTTNKKIDDSTTTTSSAAATTVVTNAPAAIDRTTTTNNDSSSDNKKRDLSSISEPADGDGVVEKVAEEYNDDHDDDAGTKPPVAKRLRME